MIRVNAKCVHAAAAAVAVTKEVTDGTNIYRHRLYAISGNSPVPEFFPRNGKFFQDPGKTSPVNIPSTKLEEDTHGTVSVNTMSRLVVYHVTSTLTRGVAGSGHA